MRGYSCIAVGRGCFGCTGSCVVGRSEVWCGVAQWQRHPAGVRAQATPEWLRLPPVREALDAYCLSSTAIVRRLYQLAPVLMGARRRALCNRPGRRCRSLFSPRPRARGLRVPLCRASLPVRTLLSLLSLLSSSSHARHPNSFSSLQPSSLPLTKRAYLLPALPYDYAALEPHVDATIMNIHRTKRILHHERKMLTSSSARACKARTLG